MLFIKYNKRKKHLILGALFPLLALAPLDMEAANGTSLFGSNGASGSPGGDGENIYSSNPGLSNVDATAGAAGTNGSASSGISYTSAGLYSYSGSYSVSAGGNATAGENAFGGQVEGGAGGNGDASNDSGTDGGAGGNGGDVGASGALVTAGDGSDGGNGGDGGDAAAALTISGGAEVTVTGTSNLQGGEGGNGGAGGGAGGGGIGGGSGGYGGGNSDGGASGIGGDGGSIWGHGGDGGTGGSGGDGGDGGNGISISGSSSVLNVEAGAVVQSGRGGSGGNGGIASGGFLIGGNGGYSDPLPIGTTVKDGGDGGDLNSGSTSGDGGVGGDGGSGGDSGDALSIIDATVNLSGGEFTGAKGGKSNGSGGSANPGSVFFGLNGAGDPSGADGTNNATSGLAGTSGNSGIAERQGGAGITSVGGKLNILGDVIAIAGKAGNSNGEASRGDGLNLDVNTITTFSVTDDTTYGSITVTSGNANASNRGETVLGGLFLLDIDPLAGLVIGDSFTFIENTRIGTPVADADTDFSNLLFDGSSSFSSGGYSFDYDYAGGDGNDLVLTVTGLSAAIPEPGTYALLGAMLSVAAARKQRLQTL